MIARAHRSPYSSNRPYFLAAVIGAHVAGIYLAMELGILRPLAADAPALPLQAFVPDKDPLTLEPQDAAAHPNPLRDRFATVVEAPRPDFGPVTAEPVAEGISGIVVDTSSLITTAPTPAPVIESTPLTFRERRAPREFYPATSLRLSEEGATTIRVCVTAQGVLQTLPTVVAGSGHARLDAAAVAYARESLRFRVATENGQPVDACRNLRVNFTLQN
ncbi:MAG: TonB family protein [Steroidobacteraceae bacterium]